jgi:hypothetical protein
MERRQDTSYSISLWRRWVSASSCNALSGGNSQGDLAFRGMGGPPVIVTTGAFKRARAFGVGVGGIGTGLPARFCDWFSGGWLLALRLFICAGILD